MPPKPNAKKGAQDAEDFSDIATLPQANIFKFQVVFTSFFTQESRNKVSTRLHEKLPMSSQDRVKFITREDIATYGKNKQIILDAAALQLLPPEDPRKGAAEEETFARAAADYIFGLQVNVRRQKKEKITKVEEEAAAKATEENPQPTVQFDADQLDTAFYFVDYPQTRAEVIALSKFSYAMNAVFEINEIEKPPSNDTDEEEEAGSGSDEHRETHEDAQAPEETHPDPQELQEAALQLLDAISTAREASASTSPLRQLAFLNVPFLNESSITELPNPEDPEQPLEKKKEAEDCFLTDFVAQYLDKYAQYYIQYLKFKQLVTVEPLMPDRELKFKLKHLGNELTQLEEQKAEVLDELRAKVTELQEELHGLEGDELANHEKAIEEVEIDLQNEAGRIEGQQIVIEEEKKHLQARLKVSLDDETDYSNFKINTYKNDFVDNQETSNAISSVLSAMVTQIETDNNDFLEMQKSVEKGQDGIESLGEAPTEAETLDDLFEHYNNEISFDLKLKDRGQDQVQEASLAETLTKGYNQGLRIHDETDRTLEVQQTVPLALVEKEGGRLSTITQREQETFANLNLPGKDRHLMPAIPTKSKRLRDGEVPGIYPFCTLPISDAERMLMLRQLQQLVRSSFIDNGVTAAERHAKFKIFERIFENHMKPAIFRQVFADALLDEPEMSSLYYPRKDALLVALYFKKNQKQTPGSANAANDSKAEADKKFKVIPEETFDLGQGLEGEKNWRAAYRVVPDFQNWLSFFADELVFEQEPIVPSKRASATQLPPAEEPKKKDVKKGAKEEHQDPAETLALSANFMKYQMDEDMLPESMLDIEDDKIQNITEKSGFMYPDDNSIMRVDHFSVGGFQFSKSLILKDNFKFGLRQREQTVDKQAGNQEPEDYNSCDEEDGPDNGLVSYNQVGDTEFWLQFENGTKFGVEQVQLKRNPQKLIRVDPPPPTAEEIQTKKEAIEAYEKAAAKAAKAKQPPPTDHEIPKTPEPTWEAKPLSHLDQLFSDDTVGKKQALGTLTLKNGLIIQYNGEGQVIQTTERQVLGNEEGEVSRVTTQEGTVIRQMRNRDAEVLFPDGVKAVFSKQNLEWIVTNNKGMRRRYKDGAYEDVERIPCAMETDAVTLACMMIREDNVVTVTYKDQSVFCQHSDGTQMHTSADGLEIRIEKEGFASQTIRKDKKDSYKYISDELRNAYQRTLDGRVLETYLPDGSMSQSFLDEIKTEGGCEQRYRHLIKRSDLSIVVLDSQGYVSLISSNTRSSLNDDGQKVKLGPEDKDLDYLRELACAEGAYLPQVYKVHVSAEEAESKIQLQNSRDSFVYTLKHDNTLDKSVGPQHSSHKKTHESVYIEKDEAPLMQRGGKRGKKVAKKPSAPQIIGELEIEETGGYLEPNTKYYQYPRFFCINSDGSAKELMSNEQLEYAMRKKKVNVDHSIKQKMSDVFLNATLENHYFLTKVINMKQTEVEQQKLKDLDFPENAKDVLQKQIEKPEISLLVPQQEQYLFQQIFKMPDCDIYSQKAFQNDFQRYNEWRISNVRYDTEFGLIHLPPNKETPVDWDEIEDEEFYNKRINLKILKYRAHPSSPFTPEEFKQTAMKSMAISGEVSKFRKSCQQTFTSNVSGSQDAQKPARSRQISSQQTERKRGKNLEHEGVLSENDLHEEIGEKEEEEKTGIEPAMDSATRKEHDQQSRLQRLAEKLEARETKKNTRTFLPEYFVSAGGTKFLHVNPPNPPSDEVLRRMQQRIERLKVTAKEDDSQSQGEAEKVNEKEEALEERDNPIVALKADETFKQGSTFLGGSKKSRSIREGEGEGSLVEGDPSATHGTALPSLYLQEKLYIHNAEQEKLLKAEEHHIVKTKDFNVYGRLRDEKPMVKSIQKSKAQSELNEKFITTECITDQRVKISSMSSRFYANAPSIDDVRRQGQHQMILNAINKKQTFAELINQANSMVTGVLHDSLKRSLNVMPSQCAFGGVRTGSHNEIILTLKNEDSIAHRITIKPMNEKRIVVKQLEYGLIAPGMIKKVSVQVRIAEDEENTPFELRDVIQICSKHDIFKIPVQARILSPEQYNDENRTQLEKSGRPIQNSRVRERLLRNIEASRQSHRSDDKLLGLDPELLTKKPKEDDSESEIQQQPTNQSQNITNSQFDQTPNNRSLSNNQ